MTLATIVQGEKYYHDGRHVGYVLAAEVDGKVYPISQNNGIRVQLGEKRHVTIIGTIESYAMINSGSNR